jgi:hypothetical protein
MGKSDILGRWTVLSSTVNEIRGGNQLSIDTDSIDNETTSKQWGSSLKDDSSGKVLGTRDTTDDFELTWSGDRPHRKLTCDPTGLQPSRGGRRHRRLGFRDPDPVGSWTAQEGS